ncbi:hypothetical protein RSK20926_01407 [Roseobacter sp. SK209-2-6]|nr:hypothetical protein RSK20926_01407 [Roseobacter sp. SK209-2-6]
MKVNVGMVLRGIEVEELKLDDIEAAVINACKRYQSEKGIVVPVRITVSKPPLCRHIRRQLVTVNQHAHFSCLLGIGAPKRFCNDTDRLEIFTRAWAFTNLSTA